MKFSRFPLLFFCLILLISIRLLEEKIFYDPFLAFFKGNYLYANQPTYDPMHLYFSIAFRYLLNALLSLCVIQLVFREKSYTLKALQVFLFAGLILLPLYSYVVESHFQLGYTLGFYIRRFLLQPMLLILLVPAFFYVQLQQKK